MYRRSVFHCAGIGDSKTRGMNHLGHEGLIKRLICGHVGLAPKVGQLCVENKIECFILPQGVNSQVLRATAGRKPGLITHVKDKMHACASLTAFPVFAVGQSRERNRINRLRSLSSIEYYAIGYASHLI